MWIVPLARVSIVVPEWQKQPQFKVLPLLGKYGDVRPWLSGVAEFVSAQMGFRTIRRHGVDLAQSRSGWVAHAEFKEWRVWEWEWRWLETNGEEHGLVG